MNDTAQLSHAAQALRASEYEKAFELTQTIIDQNPKHPEAHAIQFSSLFKAKRFEQARQIGGLAAELNPKSVFVLNNQACLQLEAKQPASASGLLKSLIDQYGERATWLYNLALAQRMVGNYEYSIATFRRTLDFQPDHDHAAFQLADCLSVVGLKEEAIRAYDYLRLLRSRHAASHSTFIHLAAVNQNLTPTGLKHEIALWAERFIPECEPYPINEVNSNDKITFGFLIGTLPMTWLENIVAPVINHLTKSQDHAIVYWHDEKIRNDVFDNAVEVIYSPKFTDAQLVRQCRADKINVMIDICGMRRGSRQRALGLQLADKQFGWLAHEGRYATECVTTIESHFKTPTFFVNESEPSRQFELPTKVFSGIGGQYGLSHKVIKTWAIILRELPDWRLHIDSTSSLVNRSIKQRFYQLGILSDRLIFNSQIGASEGTIVLDNFTENDPVSACNSIARGGILVALKGALFPAQQTASLLEQLGKTHWLCSSTADYIDRALTLADDHSEHSITEDEIHSSKVRDVDTFCKTFRSTCVNS